MVYIQTGVLEKCDLTESYNIQPKKNKLTRRHTHHVMVKASIKSLSVKAVEFQEAIIDDNMLRPISRLIKGNDQPERMRCGGEAMPPSCLKQTVAPSSVIEPPPPANEPSGYEPENSLKRVSKEVIRQEPKEPPEEMPGYEPENSLRRVRKVSENQPAEQKTTARTRRNAVTVMSAPDPAIIHKSKRQSSPALLSPHVLAALQEQQDKEIPASPRQPPSPRQPIFSLSIPEEEDDDSETSSTSTSTASPKILRKISKTQHPRPSTLPVSGRVPPSERKLLSSASSPNFTSSSQKTSNSGDKKRVYTPHNNASRYWDWYVLHASHSWKNFNCDKNFCY